MQYYATTSAAFFLSSSIAVYSATSSFHFTGDDTMSAPVTSSSIYQEIWSDTGTIHSTYTGSFSDTRAGTDGFFNSSIGGVPIAPDRTLFGITVNATGGDVTVSSNVTSFDVTVGQDVEEFEFTIEYLGQFVGSSIYDEGFTGRWSFNLEGTNNRGISARNSTAGTTGSVDIAVSAVDYGGANSVLANSDFFSGLFQGQEYGDAHATIAGYNTNSVNGTFEDNEGLFFHNGSDLGQLLDSVTFTVTPSSGTTLSEGTVVRFTFDAMTHVQIPEPSTSVLALLTATGFLSRRSRR